MKLTILGCSGSVPTAQNPASGYLLSFDNAPSIVLDMGPGTLAPVSYTHLTLPTIYSV